MRDATVGAVIESINDIDVNRNVIDVIFFQQLREICHNDFAGLFIRMSD
jgi:hypothetical protein